MEEIYGRSEGRGSADVSGRAGFWIEYAEERGEDRHVFACVYGIYSRSSADQTSGNRDLIAPRRLRDMRSLCHLVALAQGSPLVGIAHSSQPPAYPGIPTYISHSQCSATPGALGPHLEPLVLVASHLLALFPNSLR